MSDADEYRRHRRWRARALDLARDKSPNAARRTRPFVTSPRRHLASLTVIAVILAGASVAHAQGQLLGALRGTVTDEQGGLLPGVVVTAIPADSRPAISTATDAAGFYKLTSLLPGSYDIKAELSGFTTLVQSGVVARAGVSLSLNLVLTIGGVGEVVTVRREASLLETSSPTTAVNVSGDLQRALPLSSRKNWSDFFLLTPAAVSTESTFGGLTFNYFVHGADFTSHVLQMDGADISSANTGQPFQIALSTEAIADVQVKTAGVDAASPLGQGAIVNLATKSGANTVRGSAGFLYQPRRWNGDNTEDGTSAATSAAQPEFAIGGPLLRDRAWYFGTYRRTSTDIGVFRRADELALLKSLHPQFEPRDNRSRGNLYFLKGTLALTPAHHVSTFYQRDLTSQESTFSSAYPFSQSIGGTAVSARLSSTWSPRATSQLSVSYNNKTFETPPLSITGPSQNVYRSISRSGDTLVGVGFLTTLGAPISQASDAPQEKLTIAGDVDWLLPRALGPHTLRAGVYIQPRIADRFHGIYINDGFAVEERVLRDPENPDRGTQPFQRLTYDADVTLIDDRASDFAVYLQDQWAPVPRATISAGVRVDHIRSTNRVFNVETQQSTEIGPRLGVLYRLTANGFSTLRASWGRVHAAVRPVSASVGSVVAGFHTSYDLDLDGTFETNFMTPGTSLASTNIAIDSSLHQPHVDETTAGYRQQLPGSVVLDVGYVHRRFQKTRTTADVNSVFEDGRFVGYRDPAQNQVYLLTNNVWNDRVMDSLDVAVTRQAASMQFLASYSRQWRRLAGTWQPNDPAAIIQPDAFSNDRGIGAAQGNFSPAYNASSLSLFNMTTFFDGNQWRDHVVRLGGNYTSPRGWSTAIAYSYQSGSWSGPIFFRLPAPDPQFGPPSILLPNGRIVPNPLADTLRFVGPTRGDGQFSLPAYHSLNASIGYIRNVGPRRVGATVELFNVANHDADQGLLFGGTNQSDPNFRVGTNRQRPRGVQVTFRVDF